MRLLSVLAQSMQTILCLKDLAFLIGGESVRTCLGHPSSVSRTVAGLVHTRGGRYPYSIPTFRSTAPRASLQVRTKVLEYSLLRGQLHPSRTDSIPRFRDLDAGS
jgi:hypothetical protein